MIAVDTNVLLRHLYQHDDARQSQLANGIVADATAAGSSIFVSSIVLVETVWVLRQGYRIDRAGLLRVLDALSDESNVVSGARTPRPRQH